MLVHHISKQPYDLYWWWCAVSDFNVEPLILLAFEILDSLYKRTIWDLNLAITVSANDPTKIPPISVSIFFQQVQCASQRYDFFDF